jgi:hypothetical protein
MNYSTIGFFETLKPQERSLWRTDFIEPYSGATYGYIVKLWPMTISKITGWRGERIMVIKFFEREFVWWISLSDVQRCNNELSDIRESQHRLKGEMDDLRDELFHREEEEASIVDEYRMSSRTEKTAKSIAKPNEPGMPGQSIWSRFDRRSNPPRKGAPEKLRERRFAGARVGAETL